MPFSGISGQDHALATLRQAARHGRLPHAWLFTGAPHIGKARTAEALAQWLNCEVHTLEDEDACGGCPSCLQIAERTHPDFLVLKPDGKNIRMEQVHQAQRWLQLHADRARWRTLILDGAESLNRESSNAFLKTLEEPPEGTLILLIAPAAERLLETIVSRCQTLRFAPLDEAAIRAILSETTECSNAQISALLPQAMGSVPVDLLNQVEAIEQVQSTTLRWLNQPGSATLESVLTTLSGWCGARNEEWRLMLDFLERWFRDVAWVQHDLPREQLLHPELHGSTEEGARAFSTVQVHQMLDRLARVRQAISLNANKTLALEGLWIELNQCLLKSSARS